MPHSLPAGPGPLRTTYAVWEVTLKCNLKCIHCGSRAGDARPNELDTAEALDLVQQLADVGIKEVSMIGGEAFLRRDWEQIARGIRAAGMRLTMTTGGYGVSERMAKRFADAGFTAVSVSIDGLEDTHDHLRGRKGSFQQAVRAVKAVRAAGIKSAVNTQINRRNAAQLPLLYQLFHELGTIGWQTQFTVPMGNASDRPEILLQPYELLDVFPVLNELHRRGAEAGPRMFPANNVGYFGPYERRFRFYHDAGDDDQAFWRGSMAGVLTLGIEADGTIKGDPSLPTDDWAGGNIREKSLHDILHESAQLTFNDEMGADHTWGFCGGCEFAQVCRGGDTWTAHVYHDRDGNDPICHHRALHHAARGLRERMQLKVRSEGIPFDNGEFESVIEPRATPNDPDGFSLPDVQWPAEWLAADPDLPARLADERDRSIEAWRRTRLTPGRASA
jgi:radical SAM protein with 4Fe4S-binding SPASM domain